MSEVHLLKTWNSCSSLTSPSLQPSLFFIEFTTLILSCHIYLRAQCNLLVLWQNPSGKDTQVTKFNVALWISPCVGTCYSWYPIIRQTSCQFSTYRNKGFRRDSICKQISLHSGVSYQKGLLTFCDDNQEHLVWTGAYFSSAPFKLLPCFSEKWLGLAF